MCTANEHLLIRQTQGLKEKISSLETAWKMSELGVKVLKMMNFVLKMIGFLLTMMEFCVKNAEGKISALGTQMEAAVRRKLMD